MISIKEKKLFDSNFFNILVGDNKEVYFSILKIVRQQQTNELTNEDFKEVVKSVMREFGGDYSNEKANSYLNLLKEKRWIMPNT